MSMGGCNRTNGEARTSGESEMWLKNRYPFDNFLYTFYIKWMQLSIID